MRNIIELMQVKPEEHDKDWLIEALQNAVQLELATLPPYLSAMWSIKNPQEEAYTLINSIVMEEMFHMGLAANMLTTIGETPVINTKVPKYPGPLPGGVRPALEVYLEGLTSGDKGNVYKVFMQIEYPEGKPVAQTTDTYPTIGAFYTAIENAFEGLPSSSYSGNNQVTGLLGLFAINKFSDAQKAIDMIKEQGEGTSTSPEVPLSGNELAHYYKFGEIYNEKKLVEKSGKWSYTGDPVPFPDTYPMARVPEGGYKNMPADVQTKSESFNKTYSKLLDELQGAWQGGSIFGALGTMGDLEAKALALMEIPIDSKDASKGNYGPSFEYIKSS